MWLRGGTTVALLLALAACDDADPAGPGTPDTGTLEVEVLTTGDGTDSDGYTLNLDGGDLILAVAANDTVTVPELEAGDHSVELANVASHCTVEGENPKTATVEEALTEDVTFSITCTASG